MSKYFVGNLVGIWRQLGKMATKGRRSLGICRVRPSQSSCLGGGRVADIDGRDGDRGGVGNATYGTEGMGKGRMRNGRVAIDG